MKNTATVKKPLKWFYPFQDKIKAAIERANYKRYGLILYQLEQNSLYIECWNIQNNETGKIEQVVATVNEYTGNIFFYTSANKF